MNLISRLIALVMSALTAVTGFFTSGAAFDTMTSYLITAAQISEYDNTLKTAVPQTVVYDMITEFFDSELPEGKTEKKVLVLGYDGCRADTLKLMRSESESGIRTLLADGGKLVFSYAGGANFPKRITQATDTAPGWCSMLTGVWAKDHGVTGNDIEKSNDRLTLLTSLVEDGTVDDSAFYVSWGGHFGGPGMTYWQERQYIEEKQLPVRFVQNGDDNGTLASVLADVSSPECSDFIFSIFEYCDHEGHDSGFGRLNPKYAAVFLDAEKASKACIDAVKARPTYDTEDWLIIITSDHGGFNSSHGGSTVCERMTFIAANRDIDYGKLLS